MPTQSSPASLGRRRDQPVLSCSFCRGRKKTPCGSCVRRGNTEECIYGSSEQERRDANQQARQRVTRLENLVTQMRDQMREMEQNSRQVSGSTLCPPAEPSRISAASNLVPQEEDHIVNTVEKLSLTDDHAVYIGSSHWVTILEDVRDELFDDHSEHFTSRESTVFDASPSDNPPATRISLLSGHPSLSKEQMHPMIPPRKVVDRHVSHFFDTFDFAPCILHRGKFLTEYTTFWENPSAAPIMWVGLLFSTYRTLTIHCLIAGGYLRPSRYTIEILTLHFAVDQQMNLNTDTENWVLIGVIIRLGLRMGLHRDPSHWSNILPSEAEFRRRLWITLYHMDFFTSTQVGLPRTIKDSQCDVRPPANVFDDDLSFEHHEVPPERPLADPTPLSHIIQRQAIIKVAAEIYDATEAGPPSSAIVEMLSAKLDSAINSILGQSKHRSLETSIAETLKTILHQIFIDILINKGQEATRSTRLCIDTALAILEHQRRVDEETQPGGIMFGIRWQVASSLNHEFLQATMMLCLALSRFHEGHLGSTGSTSLHRQGEIIQALTMAKDLWKKDADRSVDARRAATAIASVLIQDLGFTEPIPGAAAPNYLGSFPSGQNMVMDPPFSTIDAEMIAFESLWDDLVTGSMEGNWAAMH
ncbi:hypothetical protein ASPZODRAFT_148719 [Penicilliopsis zonata CBS 506.65]|uniref:Xylanolytic transcriptional activator regulatory domain-containing protein n=1 Tax=Penicilliopsis zonata CBS 506.65 TaxID=1073090 RepID=A0A1L9SW66_9EURO|nr:hypothetical protein ASPZODRAFT_148719 [Penicilliopsis zonata CBS 506.65]OJJ51440.1 hypothetical protein ASPZODRAFT_148719 [Penicilliopsis zonata CBS 506.65]